MTTVLNTNVAIGCNLDDEKSWEGLTRLLRVRARHWVYSSHLLAWDGWEEDVVDDIVLETVYRCFEYAKRAEHGEVPPIYSLKHMAIRIAHNYYVDLLRRYRRLLHSSPDDSLFEVSCARNTPVSPFEMALELVFQEELFTLAAREVARFPRKQRDALLTDLANRMGFGEELTPLQKAFAAAGIDLRAYQRPILLDPTERANQASLRSIAYRRLADCMRTYIAESSD
jgi:DNA-directed RNA polymerase specialized sigma24 family protein